MHRLFVAIRPPEPVRDLLIDAMDDGADFRWQDEEQLHITLRFIGEVERPVADDIAASLTQVRSDPLQLRIKGVGRFEQRSSGALWAGVEPKEPLSALAAKIERVCIAAGLEPERRAFHPHITLARWKGRRTRELASFLDRNRGLASDPSRPTNSCCSKAICRATALIMKRLRPIRLPDVRLQFDARALMAREREVHGA